MRLQIIICAVAIAACALGQGGPDTSKAEMAKLQKAYMVAKATLVHSHNAATKHAFAVAADRYATAAMTTTSMTPHQRYPLALRVYREVLKVEPNNHEAKNNSDMIISVYKSMGRPVPK
jgi:hypothetical protein